MSDYDINPLAGTEGQKQTETVDKNAPADRGKVPPAAVFSGKKGYTELKKIAPELDKALMMSLAQGIMSKMRQSQERIKKRMRGQD